MQILPSTAASAAAGNVSQATSHDRAAGAAGEAAHVTTPAGVERVARSEAASPDRDAQGGGQGLGTHDNHAAELGAAAETPSEPSGSGLSVRPPEPPSQLDIVG